MKKIVNLLYGGVLSAGLLACSLQEKKTDRLYFRNLPAPRLLQ